MGPLVRNPRVSGCFVRLGDALVSCFEQTGRGLEAEN